ncbi:MAG: hypothetical protein RUMPE_01294 [Eubacteriales bacterium SKADARSKE-1]|nr:hypothetical protein [Eubacteriales bacterium SKADARSKE-1]
MSDLKIFCIWNKRIFSVLTIGAFLFSFWTISAKAEPYLSVLDVSSADYCDNDIEQIRFGIYKECSKLWTKLSDDCSEFSNISYEDALKQACAYDYRSIIDQLKGYNFTPKEKAWIALLSGAEIPESFDFRYKSCREFCKDSDDNLENFHDYIQVIFPSEQASAYANSDLFIGSRCDEWKQFLDDHPEICNQIQLNMKLNFVRMLEFWKFRVKGSLVEAHPEQQNFHNHNNKRVTRVAHALLVFGLTKMNKKFINMLKQGYFAHSSLGCWESNPVCVLIDKNIDYNFEKY